MYINTILVVLLVALFLVVFVIPVAKSKVIAGDRQAVPRTEGFASSGASDALPTVVNAEILQYGQHEFNPLSEAIDPMVPNFAVESANLDSNLSEIEYVTKYTEAANVANKQIQYAIANPDDAPELETVPPANTLVRKAKRCEAGLKGRASCALLGDPKYADCGVCIKAGTQHNGSNPGTFIGGLLSLVAGRSAGVTTPTLGKCPSGMFYVDSKACTDAVNALNCAEATPTVGRTAEGHKIPVAFCPTTSSRPDAVRVGTLMADGNEAALANAKTIVEAAKSSGNYDEWLKMLTTYYTSAALEGSRYINMLVNSSFGTTLQQSGITNITGNPSGSPLYPAYQKAYQGYMAATTS